MLVENGEIEYGTKPKKDEWDNAVIESVDVFKIINDANKEFYKILYSKGKPERKLLSELEQFGKKYFGEQPKGLKIGNCNV